MVYWSLMHIITIFLDFFTIMGIPDSNKDLEIIIIRQQVCILQCKGKPPWRISDPERMILAILTKQDRFENRSKQRENGEQKQEARRLVFDFHAGVSVSSVWKCLQGYPLGQKVFTDVNILLG